MFYTKLVPGTSIQVQRIASSDDCGLPTRSVSADSKGSS